MTRRPPGREPDRFDHSSAGHRGGLRDERSASASDLTRFLLTRTTDEDSRSRRKGRRLLRFNIKQIMYLTVWTAILLSVRQPLRDSFPQFVFLLAWASGISSALLTVGVYGLALLMAEGPPKDKLVLRFLYFLCADMLVFFVFTVLNKPA